LPKLIYKKREGGLASSRGQAGLLSVPDDEELAERLARGDAWAGEALYRKYVAAVWGLALRMTGDRSEAEDIVQDTFAEALRDAGAVRDRRALRSWLLSVAVHQAHRRFRKRRLLRVLGLDGRSEAPLLEGLAAHDAPGDVVLDLRLVSRVLRRLPAELRIAWTLRYVEGCSLEEVAAYARCSLATAKRRIAAAQARVAVHVHVELAEDVDD
jgi:RNA polymerase sigma-70 factor (ECF subfamily)